MQHLTQRGPSESEQVRYLSGCQCDLLASHLGKPEGVESLQPMLLARVASTSSPAAFPYGRGTARTDVSPS